jgi:hypothetical protein
LKSRLDDVDDRYEGIGSLKKEHTGDSRQGGGFDESGEEQGRGIGQLLTH